MTPPQKEVDQGSDHVSKDALIIPTGVPLLQLPAELRNNIYEHVLFPGRPNEMPKFAGLGPDHLLRSPHPLMHVSRVLRKETWSFWLHSGRIVQLGLEGLVVFIEAIALEDRTYITKINLYIGDADISAGAANWSPAAEWPQVLKKLSELKGVHLQLGSDVNVSNFGAVKWGFLQSFRQLLTEMGAGFTWEVLCDPIVSTRRKRYSRLPAMADAILDFNNIINMQN